MNNWQWKVFSLITILAMALAMCPPTAVNAAPEDSTITGEIAMLQPENNPGANFYVDAYPVGGGDGYCGSNGPISYNFDHYEYTLNGCDSSKDYTITAQGSGYTFNSVTLLHTAFGGAPLTAAAADITPVSRSFSGKVTKSDGITGWAGFVLAYELNGTPLNATTNGSGVFSIPNVTDASRLYFPQINIDGYDFGGEYWYDPPLQSNIIDWDYKPTGTRNIHGHIETFTQIQGCRADVSITVSAPGALTKTTQTDGDGGFFLSNLDPLNTYVVTPSRTGCVFSPASQTIDIRNGDGNQAIVFQVPNTGVWGNVKTTLGDASLAYYLIATYTTTDGVSYSNSVNWANGGYWIQAPPSTGTLTISRVGGPAAFGYETASATKTGITLSNIWSEQNFTLVPTRTISGTIVGQNGVPVQRNAMVDFGYWLHWTQSSIPVTAYSIKAQPKLYYLSPVENGIINSTPVRFLANLTTAPSVTAANFVLNLKTYLLEGCLRDFNGNDTLVLPANSVRFRPATGFGTMLYPATLFADGCGPNQYYYKVTLPKGIAGSLEVDGHNLRGSVIDTMNYDVRNDYSALGNRAITGRIYSPNLNLNINSDFRGNGMLVLREAATNALVETDGDLERTYEFTIPMLESKVYTLSINPNEVPYGYDANPLPMSPIVTASLVTGDYDVPAATGFVLVHKPIDPANFARPATGGGYFEGSSSGVPVQWAYPPMNWQDQLKGFDIQVGLAATPFTDTAPAPFFHQPNGDPAYTFYGTNGVLYRFRVRAVYEDGSKGPWMDNAPVPTLPANNEVVFPGTAAGQITFGWSAVVPSTYSGTLKYVVQYSNSPTFAVASLLPATTGLTATTTVAPLIGTTYYWRVKVQNPTGVDISDWSRTQMFFNRYKNINNGPTYQWDDFGQSPNPIRFFAASTNATLPVNAYYQVELSNDGYTADSHLFTFTKTATLATPSARQFLDGMLSDTYNWRIRIVNGNDDNAAPITDWTSGAVTIVIP